MGAEVCVLASVLLALGTCAEVPPVPPLAVDADVVREMKLLARHRSQRVVACALPELPSERVLVFEPFEADGDHSVGIRVAGGLLYARVPTVVGIAPLFLEHEGRLDRWEAWAELRWSHDYNSDTTTCAVDVLETWEIGGTVHWTPADGVHTALVFGPGWTPHPIDRPGGRWSQRVSKYDRGKPVSVDVSGRGLWRLDLPEVTTADAAEPSVTVVGQGDWKRLELFPLLTPDVVSDMWSDEEVGLGDVDAVLRAVGE